MSEKKHFSKLGLMYFFGTLIILGVQLSAGAIAGTFFPAVLNNSDASFLVSMLPMYAVGMPLMALLIRRMPGKEIERHSMTAGQWILSFFMCYAVLYLSNIVGQILTFIIGFIKGSPVTDALAAVATDINPLMVLLTMVLITPFAEEYLFRKLLIDRIAEYGEGLAVVLSAFMFGLFHGNLNQFAYAFTLGLMLGFIYVKTGKMLYTALLHMVINFMGSFVSVWVLKASGYERLMEIAAEGTLMENAMSLYPGLLILVAYLAVLAGLVITGIVLLIVKRKQFVCRQGEIRIPKGKKVSTVLLNAGMLLFVIFWLIMIVLQLVS